MHTCGTWNALCPRDFELHKRFIYCPPRIYDALQTSAASSSTSF